MKKIFYWRFSRKIEGEFWIFYKRFPWEKNWMEEILKGISLKNWSWIHTRASLARAVFFFKTFFDCDWRSHLLSPTTSTSWTEKRAKRVLVKWKVKWSEVSEWSEVKWSEWVKWRIKVSSNLSKLRKPIVHADLIFSYLQIAAKQKLYGFTRGDQPAMGGELLPAFPGNSGNRGISGNSRNQGYLRGATCPAALALSEEVA